MKLAFKYKPLPSFSNSSNAHCVVNSFTSQLKYLGN